MLEESEGWRGISTIITSSFWSQVGRLELANSVVTALTMFYIFLLHKYLQESGKIQEALPLARL
jgi:hypothetical protein